MELPEKSVSGPENGRCECTGYIPRKQENYTKKLIPLLTKETDPRFSSDIRSRSSGYRQKATRMFLKLQFLPLPES
jgi:hypothetical protein